MLTCRATQTIEKPSRDFRFSALAIDVIALTPDTGPDD